MKKILVMSAFMAFSAAFVACSSNDDLVQQAPEVPEEPVVGYPMHVSVAGTRGTDLTKATLTDFTMYSSMKTPEENTSGDDAADWPAGIGFVNNNGTCAKAAAYSAADISFPDKTNTYKFYAMNDPANYAKDAQSHDLLPTVSETNVTFGYALPTDYANQKDLLVATAQGNGTNGEVSLTFDHALALISKVYIRANVTKAEAQANGNLDKDALIATYLYKVGDHMALHGINSKGTYSFTNSVWSNQSTLEDFEIPITESPFYVFDDAWHEIQFSAGDDGLYLIPQQLIGTMTDNGNGTYTLGGAYIEVGLQMFEKGGTYDEDHEGTYFIHGWSPDASAANGTTDSETDSDENLFRPFRVPLKFTMLPNKTYAIYIDLVRGVYVSAEDDTTLYPIFDDMNVLIQ